MKIGFYSLFVFFEGGVAISTISIRGHSIAQSLPAKITENWNVWTYDIEQRLLTPVESPLDGDGWVNPTTFDSLYLPEDLPIPKAHPALGVALSYGVPRYVMPSLVLTLSTPAQTWRNRGLCSLPRAKSWIDLFAPNTPKLTSLKYSCFGQNAANLRFLEDQDGSGAWQCLLEKSSRSLLSPKKYTDLDITSTFESFRLYLESINANEVFEGFHFVDIPIPRTEAIALPRRRIKVYLTDFEANRLLELEDPSLLNTEPCAELDLAMVPTSAGRDSEFMPEVQYLRFSHWGSTTFPLPSSLSL